MKSITFKAKIVAYCVAGEEMPISITHVAALLAKGKFELELPKFIDEPTIILVEKE